MKFRKRYLPLFLPIVMGMISQMGCLTMRTSEEKQEAYLLAHHQQKPSFHTYYIQGHKIHYTQVGNDSLPLVLLVHGSPGSSDAYLDYLADTNLTKVAQLISVDRPGFGYSEFGKAEGSLAMQAKVLKPILEKSAPRKVVLVGHSLGGPVVARTAIDFPELVGGLIMVAPSISAALEPKEWFRKPMDWWIFRWMFPRVFIVSDEEILPLKGELIKMEPMWPNATAPTIVIQGDNDKLVDMGNAAFAKKMLVNSPSVEVRMVPGGSHFILWSRRDLVNQAIFDLLKK